MNTSITTIRKRDGSIADFDHSKIEHAIFRAFEACNHDQSQFKASSLTKQVVSHLELDNMNESSTPTVEEIQNIVERVIVLNSYPNVAKAYILYRKNKSDIREIKNAYVHAESVVEDYVNGVDWRVNENSNAGYSFSGLMNYISGAVIAKYALNSLYPPLVSDAHRDGTMHIHDLSAGIIGYCSGWSLKTLLIKGFGNVPGKSDSYPAKHLDVVVSQMINFLGVTQMEFAGAQAFSSVDTLLAPFVKKDNLTYIEVKQNIQRLIFGLNVASRWGSQTPFTNLTFDLKVPEDMVDEAAIVGGVPQDFNYSDCQKEMDMVNKAFLELYYAGDAKGRIFTFPIPTYNLTKDFEWDSEISDLLFQVTAKYGIPYFQNYLGSNLDPKSIRAMCCRLNINLNEIMKRPGSMWGPGDNTGSIGVVTINLNRLAYNARNKFKNDIPAAKIEFQNSLKLYMGYAKDSLDIKRKVITQNLENGLMPYTKEYLGSFDNYFSTIGINGSHEACVNILGEGIQSVAGKEFIIETLEFMNSVLQEFQVESGYLFNLEATPAESTAYRFAQKDQELCPGVYLSGTEETPYLTNSSHLPVDVTEDVWLALEHQNDIQPLYTGGTMFHTFLGEKINDPEMCKKLVFNIATKTRLPYFSITPTFSICKKCGYISGEHSSCPDCGSNCEIFSRIVGYFRPVNNWNKGKKQEFVERATYSQPQVSSLLEITTQEKSGSNGTSTNHSIVNEKGISSYVILTTPSCPNCPQAKELLKNHPITKDLQGTEKNAMIPDEATKGLIKQFNLHSVPTVVFFDESNEAIGSYSGIQSIQQYLE